MFFNVILVLPPVWLLNLGSDNIVQLDSADTKIVSQNAANKVLELMEKWKYPNIRGKFYLFLEICWEHDTSLQSLGIHDSSAFYNTLLWFFVLEIFGFSWTSLFIKYFGSISRFVQFVQPCLSVKVLSDIITTFRYNIVSWKKFSLAWNPLFPYIYFQIQMLQ